MFKELLEQQNKDYIKYLNSNEYENVVDFEKVKRYSNKQHPQRYGCALFDTKSSSKSEKPESFFKTVELFLESPFLPSKSTKSTKQLQYLSNSITCFTKYFAYLKPLFEDRQVTNSDLNTSLEATFFRTIIKNDALSCLSLLILKCNIFYAHNYQKYYQELRRLIKHKKFKFFLSYKKNRYELYNILTEYPLEAIFIAFFSNNPWEAWSMQKNGTSHPKNAFNRSYIFKIDSTKCRNGTKSGIPTQKPQPYKLNLSEILYIIKNGGKNGEAWNSFCH